MESTLDFNAIGMFRPETTFFKKMQLGEFWYDIDLFKISENFGWNVKRFTPSRSDFSMDYLKLNPEEYTSKPQSIHSDAFGSKSINIPCIFKRIMLSFIHTVASRDCSIPHTGWPSIRSYTR